MTVPRSDFGIRTFVWHADFIDTYLRGSLERAVQSVAGGRNGHAAERVVDATLEPLWAWVRTIASACDATFAASRFQVDKLSAHGAARVEYLPFGVERDVFHPGRRDESLRADLLGDNAGPLVVAIGRFAVEKRWDVVLDGYERIKLRHPGAKLVLLGDGPERTRMRARIGERSDVAFAGFEKSREKLASTLASADLLIHACPFETFGLGVAEAIAAGVPAVLPDRGGAAEQTFGPSVVLYPSLEPEALAEAASVMLSRPAAERRAQALETAGRVPSIDDHFHALFARYAELLAARRS